MNIRPARIETDLPGIASLINPFETLPVSEDTLRSWFQYNPPGRIQLRLVAVDENEAVNGYSCLMHEPSAPEHHFYVWIGVDPAFRSLGIGSALWEASLDFLREQSATRLATEVRDDDPASLGFAERRGFAIDRHLFDSILDLGTFDERPYLAGIAELKDQGIRFCALADFPDSPERSHKLYDLNVTNVLDIPGNVGIPWDFAGFEKFVLGAAWFCPAGQLLALDGDAWVGLSAVSLTPETRSAYNLHTGVLSAYRGRKIAQSLKVLAARYASQHGAVKIQTDNDSLNAPILAINRKMGYQPQPGKYLLVRWLETSR